MHTYTWIFFVSLGIDVVDSGGVAGAEMAYRHYSYGSCLHYHIGDNLNLTRLLNTTHVLILSLTGACTIINDLLMYQFGGFEVCTKCLSWADPNPVSCRIGLSLHHYVTPTSRYTSESWAIVTKHLHCTPLGAISLLAWVCETFYPRLFKSSL